MPSSYRQRASFAVRARGPSTRRETGARDGRVLSCETCPTPLVASLRDLRIGTRQTHATRPLCTLGRQPRRFNPHSADRLSSTHLSLTGAASHRAPPVPPLGAAPPTERCSAFNFGWIRRSRSPDYAGGADPARRTTREGGVRCRRAHSEWQASHEGRAARRRYRSGRSQRGSAPRGAAHDGGQRLVAYRRRAQRPGRAVQCAVPCPADSVPAHAHADERVGRPEKTARPREGRCGPAVSHVEPCDSKISRPVPPCAACGPMPSSPSSAYSGSVPSGVPRTSVLESVGGDWRPGEQLVFKNPRGSILRASGLRLSACSWPMLAILIQTSVRIGAAKTKHRPDGLEIRDGLMLWPSAGMLPRQEACDP